MSNAIKPREAPGDLELVRALVNSVDLETGKDQLATCAGLQEWLAARKLMQPGATLVTEEMRTWFTSVREAVRRMLIVGAGESRTEATRMVLNSFLEKVDFRIELGASGELRLVPTAEATRSALGRLLSILYIAQIDGSWSRLKTCRNDACLWAFYDHSKNRSGKWCHMEACGNKMKARKFRNRHKHARSSGLGVPIEDGITRKRD